MRRVLLATSSLLFAAALVVWALRIVDTGGDFARIGLLTYVDHPVLNEVVQSFRQEMLTLGYDDGQTARFFFANAQGVDSDIEPLARSLLKQRLDVLVPVSTPVSRVVFGLPSPRTTVVYSFVTNPDDLEPALSRQRGTGVSDRINYQKSLQLLRDLAPAASKVGVIYNPAERNSEVALGELRRLAPGLGIELLVEDISNPNEIRASARRLAPKVDVFFIGPDNTVVGSAETVVETAKEAGKMVVAVDSGSVEAGAVGGYSVNYSDVGRETARLVDRLLKNPESARERVIPVYNDDLLLNLCSAEAVGVQIPERLLSEASRVFRCPNER